MNSTDWCPQKLDISESPNSKYDMGPQRSGWKRWTIAGILFLVFCMAGYFSGFRLGLDDGVDAQVESRLADRQRVIYTVSYRIAGLAGNSVRARSPSQDQLESSPTQVKSVATEGEGSGSQLESLATGIRITIGTRNWSDAGGPCSMATMDPGTLVVSGSSDIHQRVAAFLDGWRKGQSSPNRTPKNSP
ncbi:MAG: hypothetical protein ACR2NZ_24490 [Rubripirellula sp.]